MTVVISVDRKRIESTNLCFGISAVHNDFEFVRKPMLGQACVRTDVVLQRWMPDDQFTARAFSPS